jgi:hypothetical protein
LSDTYNAVRKKSGDSKGSSEPFPTTLENENFNPAHDDFEAGDEVAEDSGGRCRALADFDPEKEGSNVPGKARGRQICLFI